MFPVFPHNILAALNQYHFLDPAVVITFMKEPVASWENSLGLIDLSRIKLVWLRFPPIAILAGSIRDYPYWTSWENSLEINLVKFRFPLVVTLDQ